MCTPVFCDESLLLEKVNHVKLRLHRMIQAANDYSPFFKTKRVKILTEGKLFLQELWLVIAGVHDDLLIYSEESDLIGTINDVRDKVNKHEPKLHEVYSKVWDKK